MTMNNSVEPGRIEDDVALDMKGLMRTVVRRLPFILAGAVIAGGATFFALTLVSPRFTAETKILIENREVNLDRQPQGDSSARLVDEQAVASQVQLLLSRDLARGVADRLALGEKSEFNGTDLSLLDSLLVPLGLASDPMRISPEERVIDEFNEHLDVYPEPGSRVVTVRFYSVDSELASTVANTIADEYMRLQGEAKRETSQQQTRWLGEEIEQLRGKVRDAEAAVERYRSGRDLFFGETDVTLARQQMSDISRDVATAESDQAAAEARASQLAAVLERGGSLDSASEVLNSDTFRALRSREIALRSRLSELAVTYLPAHPQIRALQSQIDDIIAQQRAEARTILSSLRNDARTAAARAAQLQENLGRLKVVSSRNDESGVELRALEREATSQRDLLEAMLTRFREAVARQNAEALPADARVISRAATPVEPSFPRILPTTSVAALAGLLLALGWVITAEFASGRALVNLPAPVRAPSSIAPTARRAVPAGRPADVSDVDDFDEVDDLPRAVRPVTETRSATDPAITPLPENTTYPVQDERFQSPFRRVDRRTFQIQDGSDQRPPATSSGGAGNKDVDLEAELTEYLPPDDSDRTAKWEPLDLTEDQMVFDPEADGGVETRSSDKVGGEGAEVASKAVPFPAAKSRARPATKPEEIADAEMEAAERAYVAPAEGSGDARLSRFRARLDAAKTAIHRRDDDGSSVIEPVLEAPRAEAVREAAMDQSPATEPAATISADDLAALRAKLVAGGAKRIAITGVEGSPALDEVLSGLSRLSIEAGSRVVVVDAVPTRTSRAPGLADLLNGEAAFAEIIRRNPLTRAHVIGYGTGPSEVARTDPSSVDGIMSALEHTYDQVFVDLGPLLDADPLRLHLVTMADHVVLVGNHEDSDVDELAEVLMRSGCEKISILKPDRTSGVDAA